MEFIKLVALVLFVLTYICLLFLPKHRAYVAVVSALLFVVIGVIPLDKVLSYVDWNVILMIAGTMGTVSLFIESKMPAKLADIIIDKVPNVKWTIISLALFAGIISAFVDNVATVLMVAPVAIDIAKKMKISPVKSIIAIAISSNLQGAATLVGDTTAILLGGAAGINFLDFFFLDGKIGIFWVVQLATIGTIFFLLYVFKNDTQPVELNEKTEVTDYFPSLLLLGTILLLVFVSFIPAESKPVIINGLICVALFIIGLIKSMLINKDINTAKIAIKEIDYFTLLLLSGLFVVVSGITEVGIVDDISQLFIKLSGNNIFVIYSLLVWVSVLLSAFIDNIPYTATMLPVVASIASILNISPYLLYFGLLSGATLGGNLTPIGASANITALGILRKRGHEVSAKEFMKLSVPFTLIAVIIGYLAIWFIWA